MGQSLQIGGNDEEEREETSAFSTSEAQDYGAGTALTSQIVILGANKSSHGIEI